jgi:hypothetical protein
MDVLFNTTYKQLVTKVFTINRGINKTLVVKEYFFVSLVFIAIRYFDNKYQIIKYIDFPIKINTIDKLFKQVYSFTINNTSILIINLNKLIIS